ncbi:hypothetical protein N8747_00760, partial [Candidatus Pelagibacter sp.]|nr:hypothetical protein [Candidatus Pelagibacter sp.]
MIKSLFKYFLFFLITAIIALIYLSYFGVETNRFNQLIKNEISKNNEKISIELQKVKIVLDIFNFSIKLKTFDPILVANKKKIELKKLETNFSIGSFVQKRFAIENVLISTKENNIKEIIDLAIVFQNSPQLYILGKMLKGGTLIANINLNFDDSGHIKNNYNIEGSIVNAELKLLNKRNIDKINFNFKIKNKFFNFDKTNLIFENLKLASKNIKIENKENYYSVEGDVRNSEEAISSELISTYLNSNFKDIGFKELNLSSENKFYFRINKKLKISNVNINSKVNLKELVYESNRIKFEEYLPNFDGKIKFSDHNIEIDYLKNDLSIKGKGNLILKKEIDKIKYEISFKNRKYDFISEIFLDNNSIYVDFLNYKKKEKKASSLVIEGRYDKNDFLYL